MGRELNHGEAAAFLGAYALDALDGDELVQVERHVRDCRACQAEVSEHREVVAYLAPTATGAPEGLWDRIAGSLEETPPPLRMPPAPVVPIERARRRQAMPSRIAAAAAAVAAVAVMGVVGVNVVDDERSGREVAVQAPAAELDRTVRAAVADPRARRIELVSADKELRADTVVLPDGTGYLVSSNLPELGAARTYQLWALVGTSKISVGVLGTKPGPAGFKAAADAWGFAITEEAAGGVVASENDPVVVGRRA
jgi:anti-sigma factor RsiW